MASGDIGIIAYETGTQGCMLPSKAFYYMAAGLIPLIISTKATTFSNLVEREECGIRIGTLSGKTLANTVLSFHLDRAKTCKFKNNSRKMAVDHFSRKNTAQFIDAIGNADFGNLPRRKIL